ncbi:MAG: hypothetical protein Q8P25_03115 [Candidatus Curtissbacteria bacterium]|nr:hypothetical protein [Candidatus Curtissbacteria bacterium]
MEKLSQLTLVDLQKASAEELTPLKSGLQNTDGTLQVLVHPFFASNTDGLFAGKYESPQAYQQQRDEFIASSLANGSPLLVFEASRDIDELPIRIPHSGTLYFVKTYYCTPEPISLLHKDEDGIYRARPDLTWQEIGDILKQAGTKTAQVGGLRLHFDSADTEYSRFFSVFNPLDPQNKSLPFEQFHDSIRCYADRIRDKIGQDARLAVDNFLANQDLVTQGCVGGVWLGLLQQGIDVDFSPVRTAEYTNNVPQTARIY